MMVSKANHKERGDETKSPANIREAQQPVRNTRGEAAGPPHREP